MSPVMVVSANAATVRRMGDLRKLSLFLFTAFAATVACSSDSGGGTTACVPGASVACVGAGGCPGFQVCKSDGSGFDSCNCDGVDGGLGADTGPVVDTGSVVDIGSDSGVGVDSMSPPTDSGTATDSPPSDGGPWSPADLPGLVVWLDDTRGVVADPAVPGGVARWLDQSGHGNDANPSSTPSGFTIDPAVINGHDALKCPGGGSGLDIADGPDLRFGTGDFGIVMVARFESDANFIEKINPIGGGAGWSLNVNTGVYRLDTPDGSAVVAATSTTKFHIIAGRGAALRIQADTSTGSGPTNTANLDFVYGTTRICFGGTIAMLYEVAEVIVVKGSLSDSDLSNATTYLKTKFKL